MERKRVLGHVEFFEDEEVENYDEFSDNNASDINIDAEMSSLSLVPSHYSRMSSQQSEKEERRASRQQKRASVVVTGGALTFVVLAAVLVTASLLLSPAIEELFGRSVIKKLILKTSISVFTNLNSSLESETDTIHHLVNTSRL